MPDEITQDDRLALRRYLLGVLSQEDGDQVEDRFATDEAYFAAYKEVERQLVSEYAGGTMTSANAACFERNYLTTSARQRHVLIVRALLGVHVGQTQTAPRRFGSFGKLGLVFALTALVAVGVYYGVRRWRSANLPLVARQSQTLGAPAEQKTGSSRPLTPPAPASPSPTPGNPRSALSKLQANRSSAPAEARESIANPPGMLADRGQEEHPPSSAAIIRPKPGTDAPSTGAASTTLPPRDVQPALRLPPQPPAVLSASAVDEVIKMARAGLPEDEIVRTIVAKNLQVDLTPADLVKLEQAGLSVNVMAVMIDPSSGRSSAAVPAPPQPSPAARPASASAPAPVATAQAPTPPSSGTLSQAEKKRVIVDAFDYSTVKSSVQAIFNTQTDIGKGIRAMLAKRIADDDNLAIIERAKVDQLMAEQDRNPSNRMKMGSGARVGRISGADAVLAGDIVVFGRDDQKTNIGGGGFARGGFAGIHLKKEEDKAVVVIDYRLIDAETSEVIATGEVRGESVRRSRGLGGAVNAGGGREIDMTSANFEQTIIGEAALDCVNKLAEILNKQAATMKKSEREVEARVADVSGNTLVISAGASDGVNVGETYEILKVLREVRDPVTKELLDTETQKSGEMTITSVRDKIATGSYVGSAPAVGFIARKKLPTK
jgi:curli biogenesis system outer membrane secretion channel CsgG